MSVSKELNQFSSGRFQVQTLDQLFWFIHWMKLLGVGRASVNLGNADKFNQFVIDFITWPIFLGSVSQL